MDDSFSTTMPPKSNPVKLSDCNIVLHIFEDVMLSQIFLVALQLKSLSTTNHAFVSNTVVNLDYPLATLIHEVVVKSHSCTFTPKWTV